MNKAKFQLRWRRWYVKATVATVVLVALLAVVWFGALKPTYTADDVTTKMQTYLRGKELVYYTSGMHSEEVRHTTNCYQAVAVGYSRGVLKGLATPHYIPYRKAWRITTVFSSDFTWLFDERSGTFASSNGQC